MLVESAFAICDTLRRGIPRRLAPYFPRAIPAPVTVHERRLKLGECQPYGPKLDGVRLHREGEVVAKAAGLPLPRRFTLCCSTNLYHTPPADAPPSSLSRFARETQKIAE